MNAFYLDPELGSDTDNTPYGWWKVAFTGGSAPAAVIGEQVQGATSGSAAFITYITLSGGSWAGNNASGTMYFYGKSAAFVSEQVNFAGGGHMHISADFVYCPWKTVSGGATAARIFPGDIIRMKKSPPPTKLSGATGQATWTDMSKTIILAEAQTASIDMCENAWTPNPSGDVTVTRTPVATEGKEGSYCMKFVFDSAPQINTLQAYFAIGALDLSSWHRISFWIKSDIALVANNIIITLCSNADGTGIVDTFTIPAGTVVSNNSWTPITLIRNGGGALGSSITSIAINTGSSITGLASKAIYVDNFLACTLTGLNLLSLITKNSAEQGGAEGLYPIQSINGTTVMIDNGTTTKATQGRGYTTSGTSPETVDTYFREGFNVRAGGVSTIWSFSDSGSANSNIELQGGFDPVTNLQDGETIFDGASSTGILLSSTSKQYWTVNWIQAWRYMIGLYLQGSGCSNWLIDNFSGGGCGNEPLRMIGPNQIANNLRNLNNSSGNGLMSAYNNLIHEIGHCSNNLFRGIYSSSNYAYFKRIKNCRNNANNGIEFSGIGENNHYGVLENISNNSPYGIYWEGSNNVIDDLTSSNNSPYVIGHKTSRNFIRKATISEALGSTLGNLTAYANSRLNIDKYNGNNSLILTDGGIIESQAATAGGTGLEWKLSITSNQRDRNYKLNCKIARVYCNANKDTTIKAYFKQSHASDIASRLICHEFQLDGISADVTAYCPADTSRNELSITIRPTASGVVEIEAEVWFVANTPDEYLIVDGTVTIVES